MNDQTKITLQTAVISDRGLNEKRPLNEDSYLSDTERRIFAVADGVGGANAGEVASQTAMEVLGEAFRHQLSEEADVEDLMEVAIQRANASIYRMAREHPKLSMMATTVVALHLDGRIATIGHVGDSRLYRLTPDGTIHRETIDHSVVEEEVQAGRMTPEQAQHHPGRNVISRALGAENMVEVDLKTIEVEDGTIFLLCSDGITRHLSDEEIRALLTRADATPDEICAEMKRLCYARGAEDNLTALIVRVGDQPQIVDSIADERTVAAARPLVANDLSRRINIETAPASTTNVGHPITPPSRIVFSASHERNESSAPARSVGSENEVKQVRPRRRRRSTAQTLMRAALYLLVICAVAGLAFYGGRKYQNAQKQDEQQAANQPRGNGSPIASTTDDADARFEQLRREVDKAPAMWANKMALEGNGKPMDSVDPEYLYLYGRALLLSGKQEEASTAFKKAIDLLKQRPARDPLKVEAKLSAAAAALRSGNWAAAQAAAKDLDEVIELETKSETGVRSTNGPDEGNVSGATERGVTTSPSPPSASQQ
jgi:protein phosphatase